MQAFPFTLTAGSHSGTMAETYEIKRLTAKFADPRTEMVYQAYSRNVSMQQSLFVFFLGAIIFLAYSILDVLVLERASQFAVIIRFVLALCAYVIVLQLRQPKYMRYFHVTVSGLMVIACLAICAMIHVEGSISPPYYIGLVQVVVFFTTMIHLSFVASLMSFLLIGIGFHWAVAGLPWSDNVLTGYFFTFNVMGTLAIVVYVLETGRRRAFIQYRARKHLNAEVRSLLEDTKNSLKRKTTFMNIISHVFKTPLHQIIGYSEILNREDWSGTPTQEFRQYNNLVNQAGHNLLTQIKRINTYSRIDSGLVTARRYPVPTQDLLDHIKSDLPPNFAAQIRVEPELSRVCLNIDPDATAMAFGEILENAIKFSDCSKPLGFFVSREEDRLKFVVENAGPGIPDGRLATLFDHLEKTEDYLSVGEAPGIGVSLAKRLLDLNSGMLDIENMPEGGVRATISLPLCADQPCEQENESCYYSAMRQQ